MFYTKIMAKFFSVIRKSSFK